MALDDGDTLATFDHPNGCIAQATMGADGQLVPLEVRVQLPVPADRTNWLGAACGACGQPLREVTDE